jgi:hypothetical protein
VRDSIVRLFRRILAGGSLSPLRGSMDQGGVDPRLAEPRLGLNSDRCFAALFSVNVQRLLDMRISTAPSKGAKPERPAVSDSCSPNGFLLTLYRYLKIADILTRLQFNLSLQLFRLTAQLCTRLSFVRVTELRECG